MPRPTNKHQLLTQSQEEHDALIAYLKTLTPQQHIQANAVGEWAVKDVIAHLTAWMQMVLDWYAAGKRGEQPITPAEGYTWQQIPALNQRIYEQHRHQPLDEVMAEFEAAYQTIMAAIEQMTEDELFSPKFYKWTKTTTLGSYATSATCSHYAWARKEIRKATKSK